MLARFNIINDPKERQNWLEFYGEKTKNFLREIDIILAKLAELNESPLAANRQLTRAYLESANLIIQFIFAIESLAKPIPTHLPPHLLMKDPVVAQRTIARNRIAQFVQINEQAPIFTSLKNNLKDILDLYLKPTPIDGNKLNLDETDRKLLTSARNGLFEIGLVEKESATPGNIELGEGGALVSDREYRQADIGAEDGGIRSALISHLFAASPKLDKETQELVDKLVEYKNGLVDISPSFMSELTSKPRATMGL